MREIIKYCFLILAATVFQGCLENAADPVYDFKGESTTEMVVYFETKGDLINRLEAPWLVDAQDVNQNLKNYLLIDTRPAELFSKGHIEGAQNIASSALLDYMNTANTGMYSKVIIISATGQAAAYYTTLLRLAGYGNVHTLKWGMASWNKEFADLWLNSCNNSNFLSLFTNESGKRNTPGNLPHNEFASAEQSTEERIRQRINELLTSGFNDYDSIISAGQLAGSPAIDLETADLSEGVTDDYLVCYGNEDLYIVTELFSPYRGLGHPKGAVLYAVASALHSYESLYTLPENDEIIMYCYNGHLSAAAVAYLRILGYKAKSLLFGGHIMFYNRLDNYSPKLNKFVFRKSSIMDYPYVSGN